MSRRCRRPIAAAALLALSLLLGSVLAGCGNRGELYREAPPAADAPEDEDEDGEDGDARDG